MKFVFSFLALGAVVTFVACNSAPETEAKVEAYSKEDKIVRGEYLVTTCGCNDCHTPKKMTPQGPVLDETRLLSGYNAENPLPEYDPEIVKTGQWALFYGDLTAAVGPWGVSYAANLTPDATGIGNWSIDNFKKALREGKFKGIDEGRRIKPPMPWENFARLTDEDIESIFLYLKSIKPVKNLVPEHTLPMNQ